MVPPLVPPQGKEPPTLNLCQDTAYLPSFLPPEAVAGAVLAGTACATAQAETAAEKQLQNAIRSKINSINHSNDKTYMKSHYIQVQNSLYRDRSYTKSYIYDSNRLQNENITS